MNFYEFIYIYILYMYSIQYILNPDVASNSPGLNYIT